MQKTVIVSAGWNDALRLVEYTVRLGGVPVVQTPNEASAYTWRNRLATAPDQGIELARLRARA